jgi:hypothetical protein
MNNQNPEESIHARVNKMVQVFAGGNKSAFGRQADIQASVLAGLVGGRMSSPSFEMMQRLLTAFPQVREQWLVMGQGAMLKPEFDPDALIEYLEQTEIALRRPNVFMTHAEARAALNTLESIRERLSFFQPAAEAIEQGVYPAYGELQMQRYRYLLGGLAVQISAVGDAELESREAETVATPSLYVCEGGPKQFIELTDEKGQCLLVALSAISHIRRKDAQGIIIVELKTQGEKSNLKLEVTERYEDIKRMMFG